VALPLASKKCDFCTLSLKTLDILTTYQNVVKISNMKAKQLVKQRAEIHEAAFAELVVWQLPQPLKGSKHSFKYRFAYVVDGQCVLRYDNETGKGDHRHLAQQETVYKFSTPKQLAADFFKDIERYNHEHSND
jgi:Family of unknown function (DUF6516)